MENNNVIEGLCLPDSEIFIENNELIKKDDKGNEMGRFKLESISNLNLSKKFDSTNFIIFVVSLVMLYVGYEIISTTFLKWSMIVISGILLLISIFSFKKTVIAFDIKGDKITYSVTEKFEDVQGFVVSLKILIKECKDISLRN